MRAHDRYAYIFTTGINFEGKIDIYENKCMENIPKGINLFVIPQFELWQNFRLRALFNIINCFHIKKKGN